MNSKFSFNRFCVLCKNDLILYKKNIILFFIFIIFACFLMGLFLPASFGYYGRKYIAYLAPILMGIITLTGFSFIEFDSEKRSMSYLLLPATLKEKYLSRCLFTLFGYFILGMITYIILQYFVYHLNNSSIFYYQEKFILFREVENPLIYLNIYLLFHSIFIFGAVFYKKNSFLKTAISCFIIFAIFLLWMKLLHMIFIPEADVSFFISIDYGFFYTSEKAFNKFIEYKRTFSNVMSTIAFYIIPPILWVLGYFRLKEKEVADGVQ